MAGGVFPPNQPRDVLVIDVVSGMRARLSGTETGLILVPGTWERGSRGATHRGDAHCTSVVGPRSTWL